ncbi:hypothetical protein PACILC2_53800 [Paenibacillus cisolokensis]|uniref:Uncharacterized protein n=1 Tax=Paenibacillus cisolokensis TaxID=1658519 RepID=A0ABQ4NF16_9BACL|nr:hypothetical protein PACILC2_53800 [Paenibacillus cisolokensis]
MNSVEFPEPYVKAVKNIESADFDTAIKYLDLTISDFKDSQFFHQALILKSILYRAKLQSYININEN